MDALNPPRLELRKWKKNVARMCAGTAKMLTCVDLRVCSCSRRCVRACEINEGCGAAATQCTHHAV